jgi:archaellum component FlaC
MKDKSNRSQWLHLRLMPEELASIQEKFKNTTCRKFSDYARKVLLDHPVTVIYRNRSLDDFMEEMVRLKNELNIIGNNFNQAVKKLHTFNQISEFRNWTISWSSTKERLEDSIKEIKSQINKVTNEWLR